ncbi:MAG: MFS transporter [Proteobacteria bacterium]|nr:MFS transporter [Pseudomonadota bacterium]
MRARFLRLRVRWPILACLFGFAFVAYMQRTSFSVAAAQMMPDLGISQIQLGWLMTIYLVPYTALQLPGGLFGQWIGARKALVYSGLLGFIAAIATPLAPLVSAGAALLAVLMLARLLLGVAHAPLFPVSTGAIESWFPVGHWSFPNGLQVSGLQLGSAAATPMIAFLMTTYGWKNALVWTALPALLLIALWAWYGRDKPAQHPRVSAAELAELKGNESAPAAARITFDEVLQVLSNRDVLLLAISYTIMNYVFYLLSSWCFLYLVQERHLSVPQSGLLGSLPFIAAAIGAAVGGKWSDRLAVRFGLRIGYRAIPLVALPLAGVLLFVGVKAASPFWAVAALSLAYGVTEMTEGPYAAATTAVSRENAMAAWGVVGTGGNLGGIIGTPIVAWLSSQHAWTAAFITGAGAAIVSGLMWLWIDGSRAMKPAPSMAHGH